MGMFDRIEIDSAHGLPEADEWQTKDTPSQRCDVYRIDAEGRLLYQDYDIEDRSKPGCIIGMCTRVNKRFVETDFRGGVVFYTEIDGIWHEYSALFDDGKLISIKQIEPEPTESEVAGD